MDAQTLNELEIAYKKLINSFGNMIDKIATKETPRRVVNMYQELLSGYKKSPEDILNNALFEVVYDEMVVVRDIDFYSLCEHHFLPFFGKVHVGYLPAKKVIGLSKIPRLVDMYSKRLQIQERLTMQIATQIEISTEARGVGVVIEAMHLCASIRGVKKQSAKMISSTMLGKFRTELNTRQEFLSFVQ